MDRIDTAHGMYRILAAERNGAARAVAYAGTRVVGSAAADDSETAVRLVREALDERVRSRQAARTGDVPLSEEFADAFDVLRPSLSRTQNAIVAAHCLHPERAISLSELAGAAGCTSATAEREYARLGRQLAALLGAPVREKGTIAGIAVLAETGTQKTLRLRPVVVERITGRPATRSAAAQSARAA